MKMSAVSSMLLLACGCGQTAGRRDVALPMTNVGSAYEAAAATPLPERAPEEYPGLHNVYRLSDDIVSGSEPGGAEAFARLRAMGVRTILSVDGKAPDSEAAARYGLRYVHVPIKYSGITYEQRLKIAKTFRELDGPFYVHCFHGKHRGPAAAALGRLVLDGVSRGEAIAEMRQWCGTAAKYEGLYRDIATAPIPPARETGGFSWDFPAEHPLGGLTDSMVGISRSFEHLQAFEERAWQVDPDHPDIDAGNEADMLRQFFARANALEDVKRRPEDFRRWMDESVENSARLFEQVAQGDRAGAAESLKALAQSCAACHTAYRN